MPLTHIAICGRGLAAQMTAAALSANLPKTLKLTLIETDSSDTCDAFYGQVTPPEAYDFNLNAGVNEPELILESQTSFALGTLYENWSAGALSWLQGAHLPLPVSAGVPFQHYLTRLGQTALEPYLITAIAARSGKFAHPPTDPKSPLSRAEYGYQISPDHYATIFARAAQRRGVEKIVADINDVVSADGTIKTVRLSTGQTIDADMYIDCTGPEARLLESMSKPRKSTRTLGAVYSYEPMEATGSAYRHLRGTDYGWTSVVSLQGGLLCMDVFHPDHATDALSAHTAREAEIFEIGLGRRPEAWVGNCVGVGQAAGVLEALSLAPMRLLQRDIERLLNLIPLTRHMTVEKREYNHQFRQDFDHAHAFNRAFFETATPVDSLYWQAAKTEPVSDNLAQKLLHFERRGYLLDYDLEPFNTQDWLILHYGMARIPTWFDITAEQIPLAKIEIELITLKAEIARLVEKMPPHGSYIEKLKAYLVKKGHTR